MVDSGLVSYCCQQTLNGRLSPCKLLPTNFEWLCKSPTYFEVFSYFITMSTCFTCAWSFANASSLLELGLFITVDLTKAIPLTSGYLIKLALFPLNVSISNLSDFNQVNPFKNQITHHCGIWPIVRQTTGEGTWRSAGSLMATALSGIYSHESKCVCIWRGGGGNCHLGTCTRLTGVIGSWLDG